MLHHASLEVDPADLDRTIALLELLGFSRVPAPQPLVPHVTWLESDGTQIHLIHTEGATVPPIGHVAVAVDDFDAAFRQIAGAGFEIKEARQLWGERRAFATGPGGHRIELMAAPPPTRS